MKKWKCGDKGDDGKSNNAYEHNAKPKPHRE